MSGVSSQLWVTSALTDDEVRKALTLNASLRLSLTTRKIAVIVSSSLESNLKQALYLKFDLVFFLDKQLNVAGLKLKDFVKVFALTAFGCFEKCVYLSPSLITLQNCDDIFAADENVFGLDEISTPLYVFWPSVKVFQELNKYLVKFADTNNLNIERFFGIWNKKSENQLFCLPDSYRKIPTNRVALATFEKNLKILDLVDYPNMLNVSTLANTNILGKLVAEYWVQIQRDHVLPLFDPKAQNELLLPSIRPFPTWTTSVPIGIVGMSCRYPGSNNLDEFWNVLCGGQNAASFPPTFRWNQGDCCTMLPNAKSTIAGFLKCRVDEFDAKFFGVPPNDALLMDPQHRLLHELVWEGLENACINPHELSGTNGAVFTGSWLNEYKDILNASGNTDFFRRYMGTSIGAAAARISRLLGLTGPCVATESGCSSAISAVHMACTSLRQGETNMAIACGVNMMLDQFDQNTMPSIFAPDGRCKTFSEDANGYCRSEGGGVLILKRLSDALQDGDHVWGIIRGSAVSQEGLSRSMGTPTVYSEALAMKHALAVSRVAPEEVSYVEAHGTGTEVGDPMEVAAILKAYATSKRADPLIIGSVKTIVGHTESCSGITGIIKVILSLKHEIIPAHLNISRINPAVAVNLDAIPAVIPLEKMSWRKVEGKPRLAGLNSFGITGTDAHIILQEPPSKPNPKPICVSGKMERPLHILKMSAKTDEALAALLEKYERALAESPESWPDIAYSANIGRADFPFRAAVIAANKEEAAHLLATKNLVTGEANPENVEKICFLFTGQGSQYETMAQTLHNTSPVFQTHFDFCAQILKNEYYIDIVDILWNTGSEQVNRTLYSQTAIFCVQYALVKLWESWGVKPNYVLGHSLGEFAAAACAGVLTVQDALKLVANRSLLIDRLPQGSMLAVKADQSQVDMMMQKFVGKSENGGKLLDYAALNCPLQTVVAGDSDVVLEFSKFCSDNNVKSRMLAATHAFHSRHMDPMLDMYRAEAATIRTKSDWNCEYISGVNGALLKDCSIDADYWVRHAREKVDFIKASKAAIAEGCRIFIEIGPQPVLSALLMSNTESPVTCLPSLRRTEDDWNTMLGSVAKLYVKGVPLDWRGFDQFCLRRKVLLPTYPFMGKRFWPDMMQYTGNVMHPLVGIQIPNASDTKLFQGSVKLRSHTFIKDHAIGQ